jgi:hypothetical protein
MNWVYIPISLGAALSGYALFVELRGNFGTQGETLAWVRELNGAVRHLPSGELSWDRSLPGTPLGDRALISTQADSRAKLAFASGEEVVLLENTTLLVTRKADAFELKLLNPRGRVRMSEELAAKVSVESVDAASGESKVVDPKTIAVKDLSQLKLPPVVAPKASTIQAASIRNPNAALNQREVARARLLPASPRLMGANRVEHAEDYLLEWKPGTKKGAPTEGLRYEVVLKMPEGTERVLPTGDTRLRVGRLKPGRYQWSVRAIGQGDLRSPMARYAAFKVEKPTLREDSFHLYPVKVK